MLLNDLITTVSSPHMTAGRDPEKLQGLQNVEFISRTTLASLGA